MVDSGEGFSIREILNPNVRKFKELCQEFPHDIIGIHGTTLPKWASIKDYGLDPKKDHPDKEIINYMWMPVHDFEYEGEIYKPDYYQFKKMIAEAGNWGGSKTRYTKK